MARSVPHTASAGEAHWWTRVSTEREANGWLGRCRTFFRPPHLWTVSLSSEDGSSQIPLPGSGTPWLRPWVPTHSHPNFCERELARELARATQSMSEEALRMAASAASFYFRRSLGMAAGGALAVGLGGSMLSIVAYATALPPMVTEEANIFEGFNEATAGLTNDATEQQQQARMMAAAVTGAAVLGPMRQVAKKAA